MVEKEDNLFGQIIYNDPEQVNGFIEKIRQGSIKETIMTITSALHLSQSKGHFTIHEAEAVSAALRTLGSMTNKLIEYINQEK